MQITIGKIEDGRLKSAIAREILEQLTDWFGLEDSREEYIRACAQQECWAARQGERAVGFIAMRQSAAHTAEISVMGVLPEMHRQGVGRRLVCALEQHARRQKYFCLQVKTVAEGRYAQYDCTRRFYEAMGFYELEVFPTLWDEWNPCSVLIKPLA